MASTIHTKRAKAWKTDAQFSKLLAQACHYYHDTQEGRASFVDWVLANYGTDNGENVLRKCCDHDLNISIDRRAGWDINASAVDLGIPPWGTYFYHRCAISCDYDWLDRGDTNLPSRGRRESTIRWLVRRNETVLNGGKLPEFDWRYCHDVATSEAELAHDTGKMWRTDPETFYDEMEQVASRIIPFPEGRELSLEKRLQRKFYDAFKQCVTETGIAHMTWAQTVSLFTILEDKGLESDYSIERECKKDPMLLREWATSTGLLIMYSQRLWRRLALAIAGSKWLRPYMRQYWLQGRESVEIYIPSRGFPNNGIRWIVEDAVRILDSLQHRKTFFDSLGPALAAEPRLMSILGNEAFELIGTIATVQLLLAEMVYSPFGQRLQECVASLDSPEVSKAGFLEKVSFMDTTKFNYPGYDYRLTEEPRMPCHVLRHIAATWEHAVHSETDSWRFFAQIARGPETFKTVSNRVWFDMDHHLWVQVAQWDRPNEMGCMAAKLGLFSHLDPDRPSAPSPKPEGLVIYCGAIGIGKFIRDDEDNLPSVFPAHFDAGKHRDVFLQLLGRCDSPPTWSKFTKAFAYIGFDVEPTGGSKVMFTYKSKSIIFHKPHGPGDCSWWRGNAHRMKTNLKWTEDMFW